MKQTGIIYKYVSPSGKIYIGQTTNEEERRKRFLDKNEIYAGVKIQKERLLYPELKDWKYEVIKYIEADSYAELHNQLDFWESKYILELDSIDNGLNAVLGNPHFPITNNQLFTDYILSKYDDETIILRYFRYSEYISNNYSPTQSKCGLYNSNVHKFITNLYNNTNALNESREQQIAYQKKIDNFDIDHPKSNYKKQEKIEEFKKKIAYWKKQEERIIKTIYNRILTKSNKRKYSDIMNTFIVNYCINKI